MRRCRDPSIEHLVPPVFRSVLRRIADRLRMRGNRRPIGPDARPLIVLRPGGASRESASLVARAAFERGHIVHLFAVRFPEGEAR